MSSRLHLHKGKFLIHVRHLFLLISLQRAGPMAALDDAGKRVYIAENAAADLQYVLEDSAVPLDLQYRLVRHYTSLKIFAAMGDSPGDIRAAAQADFALDPAASAEARASAAKLVSAWNLARDLAAKEKELFAESKVLGAPRVLQHSERQAMLKAVENAYGRLQESEIPANEYMAVKLEEVENGEPTASALDEIISKQEKNTSSLQTSLDAAGHLRVTKVKGKGKLPESTEDYRRLMKIEGITWLCLAAKFKSKAWLQDLRLSDFNKFVEYILGERVNGIKISISGTQQPLRPPWSIVLDYEFKLRKEAFKHVIRGKGTLKEALEEVVKDSELKEAYFVTPLTLASHEQPNKYQRTGGKGNQGHPQGGIFSSFGKGKHSKGKNHKKGKGKGGFKGDTALVSQTPDGRDICYAFNAQGCAGKCGRVHCCRVRGCFGQHSAREHHLHAKNRAKSPPKTSTGGQE